MTHETAEPPVPTSIQAVLALFDNELAELKFPDLDRSVLQQAAHSVGTHAEELARAEAAVQAARELVAESQELLLQKCQRALAYARVYAEDNLELLQKLELISLPRSGRVRSVAVSSSPPEARPSGRRGRRANTPSGPLFLEPASSEETPPLEHQAA